MKKSKFMLSVLAAAMLVTSAGALVACGKQPEGGEQGKPPEGGDAGVVSVTFNANGGSFAGGGTTKVIKTDANGHIATEPAAPSNGTQEFLGYFLEQAEDGTTKITYGGNGYKFTATTTTVYAHWGPEQQGGPPEHGGNSEYTVTLDAGEGSCATETLTTTNGKLTSLPNAIPPANKKFDGWFTAAEGEGGTEVTTDTPFNADGITIYAHYSPINQQPPELVAGDYNLYVNDKLVNNALDAGTDGAATRPDNLVYNYYAENVVLEKGDTVKFVLKDITISKIWAKGGSAIVGVKGFGTNDGANIDGDTVTVLDNGTYTVSISQYENQKAAGEASVYIGPYTGEYEQQQQTNVDPNPPAKVHTAATINGETMLDTTDSIDRTWAEYEDWSGYQNHTLAEQYKASLNVTAETTYSFKADGTAIGSLWIERDTEKALVQIKVDGNLLGTGVKGADGSSFTLVAGTYDVYLKYYHDTENNTESWTVWVEGTQKGSFDQGDIGDTKADGLYVGDTCLAPISRNKNGDKTYQDGTSMQEYWLGGSTVKLNKNDKITLWVDGKQVEAYVEGSSAGVDKSVTDKALKEFTVTTPGDFAIYLHKNLKVDGSFKDYSCQFSGPTEVEHGSEIPQGAAKVEITFAGGHKVTLYLQTSNGTAVGASDLSKYAIYTFSAEVFGKWEQSVDSTYANNGILKSEMTVSGAIPNGWIIRWKNGSSFNMQTSNIEGTIKAGGTYVIKLPATNEGTPAITAITDGTDVDPYEDAQFYLLGVNGWDIADGSVFVETDQRDATETNVVHKYVLSEVSLSVGDTVKILRDGVGDDVAWTYNNYEQAWTHCKWENNNLNILANGKFTFYLKIYDDGGSSVWVSYTAA